MQGNPLYAVPGLGGYLARKGMIQDEETDQLKQAGAVLSLQGAIQNQAKAQQAQQREAAYRAAIEGLGPNPTQEGLAAVASKFAAPDDVLKIHQGSLDRQEQTRTRAQQFYDSLEQRRAQFEQTAAQKERDAEMLHETRLGRLQNDQERNAEIARRNAERAEIDRWKKEQDLNMRRMEIGINAQLRQQGFELQKQNGQIQLARLDLAKEQKTSRDVQQLGAALEKAGLPEADTVLGAVEDALGKTPQLAEYLVGIKSKLPDSMVPADVAKARQAFQKLFNITLKNRSGAAVTSQELERLKQEFATGVWQTKEQIEEGVKQARNVINKHYASVSAGFGKDVLDRYDENIRQLRGRVVLGGESGPKQITSDAEFNALPSGAEFIGPDGKKRRKP